MSNSNFVPGMIIKRSDAVTRMTQDSQKAVKEAITRINTKITSAGTLPISIPSIDFGPTEIIRSEVEKLIKDSGWRVTRRQADVDGSSDYILE